METSRREFRGKADFDPELIKGFSVNSKAPRSRSDGQSTIYVRVDGFVTERGQDESTTYVLGTRLDDPEQQVRVRLNTVYERMEDLEAGTDKERAKQFQQVSKAYSTGARVRPSLSELRGRDPIVIKFESAVQLEDGEVQKYRAHWPRVVATKGMEVNPKYSTVVVSAETDNQKAKAHVDIIDRQVILNPENILIELPLAIDYKKNSSGDNRMPIVHVRLFHKGELMAMLRMFPSMESKVIFDNKSMKEMEVFVPAEAMDSTMRVVDGEKSDLDMINRHHDALRAVIYGMMKWSAKDGSSSIKKPPIVTDDVDFRKRVENIFSGVASGRIQVDMLHGERVKFGGMTRKNIISQYEEFKRRRERGETGIYNVYAKYKQTSEVKVQAPIFYATDAQGAITKSFQKGDLLKAGFSDREIKKVDGVKTVKRYDQGYMPTVIGSVRRDNGSSYVTFAEPLDRNPKTKSLSEIEFGDGLQKEVDAWKVFQRKRDNLKLRVRSENDADDSAMPAHERNARSYEAEPSFGYSS